MRLRFSREREARFLDRGARRRPDGSRDGSRARRGRGRHARVRRALVPPGQDRGPGEDRPRHDRRAGSQTGGFRAPTRVRAVEGRALLAALHRDARGVQRAPLEDAVEGPGGGDAHDGQGQVEAFHGVRAQARSRGVRLRRGHVVALARGQADRTQGVAHADARGGRRRRPDCDPRRLRRQHVHVRRG